MSIDQDKEQENKQEQTTGNKEQEKMIFFGRVDILCLCLSFTNLLFTAGFTVIWSFYKRDDGNFIPRRLVPSHRPLIQPITNPYSIFSTHFYLNAHDKTHSSHQYSNQDRFASHIESFRTKSKNCNHRIKDFPDTNFQNYTTKMS